MIRHLLGKGYSRMQEAEADREGFRLAACAGFDVRASVNALERLAQVAPSSSGLNVSAIKTPAKYSTSGLWLMNPKRRESAYHSSP